MTDQPRNLTVTIHDLSKVVFEGEVYAVSSTNESGPFDILSAHTNFITLIRDYIVLTLPDKQKKELKIDVGVLKNLGNHIEIYLGIGGT